VQNYVDLISLKFVKCVLATN